MILADSIPEALRALPQWVTWRSEPNGNGKPTKVPYVPGTNQRASSTDPASWTSFDSAVAKMNGDAGVGFVFTATAGIVGIDLDGCISDGRIAVWAQRIISRVGSYAERSPGSGVHILARGVLPAGARKRGSLEMYSDLRFFTITGTRLEGAPTAIELADVAWLHRLMSAGVFDFGKNFKLVALMNGDTADYGSDDSKADLALCSLLARLRLSEADIDSAFRLSGLMRSKWDEKRGDSTWGRNTIRKALEPQTTKPANIPARSQLLLTEAGSPRACAANIVTVLRDSPEWQGVIRFDEFSERVTIRKPAPGFPSDDRPYPREWADSDDVHVTCWLQKTAGILVNSLNTVAQAIQAVARENRFHPVRQFLESMVWDRVERADHWLEICFGVEPSSFISAISRRWLISAIARIFQPGCQVDHMLLLIGAQGIGKSSGLRALVPRPEWFADSLTTLGSRDARLELRGKWIVELSELSALRRAEIEATKSFLSERSDHYRPPYGRHAVDVPRQCVFAGSTNDDSPLLDSENRRFWPVRCGKIDVRAIETYRAALWAEALVYYKRGDPWWLDTSELNRSAEAEQKRAYAPGVWDEILATWLERPVQRAGDYRESLPWHGSQPNWINVTDALIHACGLEISKVQQRDAMIVTRFLRHLGWVQKQQGSGIHRGKRYWTRGER